MKKCFLSLGLAVALALSLFCATALAVENRASITLGGMTVTAVPGSNQGEIKISYDVKASGIADRVGVSSIKIYKSNGAYVTTITGSTENGLIRTNAIRHRSSYIYTGTSGTSYYAVVTVFADIGADSDSDEATTATVKAP